MPNGMELDDFQEGFCPRMWVFELHISSKMNILIWNCKGAMKPSFRSSIYDLTSFHSPGIIVVTETRISNSKANDILRSLPYDGIHTIDPNGYAGGIWLL